MTNDAAKIMLIECGLFQTAQPGEYDTEAQMPGTGGSDSFPEAHKYGGCKCAKLNSSPAVQKQRLGIAMALLAIRTF